MLQPMDQEKLEAQYHLFMAARHADEPPSVDAIRLARFAEARAQGEANRQIEALQEQIPKPVTVVENGALTASDAWKVHFKLHSSHFDYFLWMLAPGTPGCVIVALADEATLAVQEILESHKEKP